MFLAEPQPGCSGINKAQKTYSPKLSKWFIEICIIFQIQIPKKSHSLFQKANTLHAVVAAVTAATMQIIISYLRNASKLPQESFLKIFLKKHVIQ